MTAFLAQEVASDWIDWSNQTNMHPISLAIVLIASLFLLLCSRRLVMWPFVIVCCFITVGQRFVVAELDFPVMRLLCLAGFARVLARSEFGGMRFMLIDKLVLTWAVVTTIANVWMVSIERPDLVSTTFIYRLGWLFDNVGLYFLFRCFIREWKDLERVIDAFALMAIPVAMLFLIEKSTGKNLFFLLGGVPENTMIRNGRLRCQGCFSHPILAGCFWAGMIPMFFARFLSGNAGGKLLATIGAVCVVLIVFATSSSTPVMALIFTAAGILLFFMRHYMSLLRWVTLGCVIGLHMVMKAPVWHLLARIDFVGGSTGYHRFALIDECIKRFDEWWLYGTYTTAHWGYHLFDVTNFFVLQCVQGGFLAFVLFVAILGLAFRSAHRLMRILPDRSQAYWTTWLLGVALFVHGMNFIAVSYFGKALVLFLLQMAALASLEAYTGRVYAFHKNMQLAQQQRHHQMLANETAAAEPRETSNPVTQS